MIHRHLLTPSNLPVHTVESPREIAGNLSPVSGRDHRRWSGSATQSHVVKCAGTRHELLGSNGVCLGSSRPPSWPLRALPDHLEGPDQTRARSRLDGAIPLPKPRHRSGGSCSKAADACALRSMSLRDGQLKPASPSVRRFMFDFPLRWIVSLRDAVCLWAAGRCAHVDGLAAVLDAPQPVFGVAVAVRQVTAPPQPMRNAATRLRLDHPFQLDVARDQLRDDQRVGPFERVDARRRARPPRPAGRAAPSASQRGGLRRRRLGVEVGDVERVQVGRDVTEAALEFVPVPEVLPVLLGEQLSCRRQSVHATKMPAIVVRHVDAAEFVVRGHHHADTVGDVVAALILVDVVQDERRRRDQVLQAVVHRRSDRCARRCRRSPCP